MMVEEKSPCLTQAPKTLAFKDLAGAEVNGGGGWSKFLS